MHSSRYRFFALRAAFSLLTVLASAMALTFSQTARADSVKVVPGCVPPAVLTSSLVGPVAPSTTVGLALILPMRNQTDLSELLQRLYNPADPNYGQYLSAQQFADRYGPTPLQYHSLEMFAVRHGLKVTKASSNRLILDIAGPTSAVQSTFGVQLNQYRDRSGRIYFAPDRNATIPVDIASDVVGIVGLDNAYLRRANRVQRPSSEVRQHFPNSPTGPDNGYSPSDIASAYNLTSLNANGSGQTLGLFELDVYSAGDISAYESKFSLPSVPLNNISIDGGAIASGADDEVTLDIELEIAMAQGASNIMVYEAPNSNLGVIDAYNQIAADDSATSISSSWGLAEDQSDGSILVAENNSFEEMAAQGQAIFVASGDYGAYEDGSTLSVTDPASQPYAVAVGGTTLTTSSSQQWQSETTWDDVADGWASGGGISSIWPIPSWQTNATTTTANPEFSTTFRNVPDVSLDADPYTGYSIYWQGAWSVYGGTSCAAPLWAGFDAIVNQARLSSGQPSLGFPNPALYSIAEGSNGTQDFHDIADDSNNFYYHAFAGYDLATGWGTLNGANLFADLTSYKIAPPPTFSPKAGTYSSTQQVTISDSLGSANIYYTTDGSTPTSASTLYTSSITVSKSTTIRAIATATGYATSRISEAAYVIPYTLAVTNTGDTAAAGSLRAAITYANSNPGATISLASGLTGTITLTSDLPSLTSSMAILGPGASSLAIDGDGQYRIFDLESYGISVTISGLTIQNGSDQADGLGGGGILVDAGNLTLNNCKLKGNSGSDGGAIENFDNISVMNCTLSGNTATYGGGGAISNDNIATVTNCTISSNVSSNGYAGGIDNESTATVTGCTLSQNGADDGDGGAILNGGYFVGSGITVNNSVLSGNTCTNGDGGAFSNNAEATLSNCTFSGNICNSGYGGGVSDSYSAAFTNCTISGNTAGEGGGFFQYTDQAILTNCTIVGNAAPFGAGILNYAGIIAATNCTLSGNTASTGGGAGIFNDGFFGQAIATLTNCILYGDTGGEISNTDTLDVSYSDVQGGAAGTGNISSNPLLKSLGNYGGPTQTMALQAGSPCFGAGTASGAPTTDQRGMPRPNPPSMGAFDGNQSRFDFNGDGKDDLLWQNSQTGQLAVWDMNGMGISSTSVGNVFATINPIWKIKGVADINGDGHPDLLWWNSNTGQIIFWEMTGAQGTSQLYASPVVYTVPNTQWQPVSMADFDGDGHPDILWENMTTGQLIIWYMNGTTQKSATGVFATIPSDCRVAGTGDFNQDGHPDIVLESKTSGAIAIWYMGGTGGTTVLSKSGAFMTISNLSWQIVSTGDMDGDGHPDLTWHNTSTGQTIVWLMGGANGTTQLHAGAPLAASPKTTWSIVGVR